MRDYSAIVSDIRPADFDMLKQEYANGSAGFADRVRATGAVPNVSDDDLAAIAAEFSTWRCYVGK